MKEEISFTQVPFDYPLCLNGQCPKAATCLRQLAMQSMPTEKDYWKIISPKRLATVKGECPFYRSSQKARYAKGFMNMLNSLPYNKRGIAIANLIAGFGQRTYYPRPQRRTPAAPRRATIRTERLQTSGCRHGYRI